MNAHPRSLLLCLIAAATAGCGDDSSSTGAGGATSGATTSSASGSTSNSTATSTSSSTGGGGGQGGGGGGLSDCFSPECCVERGQVPDDACNFQGSTVPCVDPVEPGPGEFSCFGLAACSTSQACVRESPSGDGCTFTYCADLPEPCVDEPTCACLAVFLDAEPFPQCADEEGHPHVFPGDGAFRPPWDSPYCGEVYCEAPETCWTCSYDVDDPQYTCAEEDPSTPGELCYPR